MNQYTAHFLQISHFSPYFPGPHRIVQKLKEIKVIINRYSTYNKMHALLVLLLVLSTQQMTLRQSHEYWFIKENPSVAGDDSKWGYCDLKCLYLQKYSPNKDFVVIVLGAALHDTFAACYVKTPEGYTLWNKVISNAYYEENCGQDYKDWANTGEFDIKGIFGVGIGAEMSENATYSL